MPATVELLEVSARRYGVLWTPMSFFYPDGGGETAIRLACSALGPADIREGVRRLAEFVAAHRPHRSAVDHSSSQPRRTRIT
jgi:DNA-binding transcriptional MocR family regulator